MLLHTHSTAVEFLSRAAAFLNEREAENNLLLGIAGRLAQSAQQPASGREPHFYTIEEGGRVVAAALLTPPHRMVLSRGPAVAMAILADALARARIALPGIVGPNRSAADFAAAWGKLSRRRITPELSLRIYQIEKVSPPPPAGGSLRPAEPDEMEMLVEWHRAFRAEVHEDTPTDDRATVATALGEGRLYVWVDPHPVCLAGHAGPTLRGVRINSVFTPPQFRRRGYASNCVAALSQLLLDAGRSFCFLFADLANPTSNHIYQHLGYAPVADFRRYNFE